ncbi:MAG: 30S ribosomal protein S6 [Candidatus Saccharimonadales bacterium]|jgi:small subunit ribosomal protein S6
MREYELVVVLNPDLETDLEAALTKIRAIVTDNGGKLTKEEAWGKKRLAYRIAKEDYGIYVVFEAELPADAVAKVNGTLNITEGVLRFLLTSIDVKARKALADAEAEKAEKREEE